MKQTKLSNLFLVFVSFFVLSCQKNRENDPVDSITPILLNNSLSLVIDSAKTSIIDKNIHTFLTKTGKYQFSFLTDPFYLSDSGKTFYSIVFNKPVFDFNNQYVAYVQPLHVQDSSLYIYSKKEKTTKKLRFKHLPYIPQSLLILGKTVVVSDAWGDHYFNIETDSYKFRPEGNLHFNSNDNIDQINIESPNTLNEFFYWSDSSFFHVHKIIRSTLIEKHKTFDFITKTILPNGNIEFIDSTSKRNSGKSFRILYTHKNLGVLYESLDTESNKHVFLRYLPSEQKIAWSAAIPNFDGISIGYPFLGFCRFAPSDNQLRTSLFDVHTGRFIKRYKIPFLTKDKLTHWQITSFRHLLMITYEGDNKKCGLVIINITTNKTFHLRGSIYDYQKLDFFDKKGDHYLYVQHHGIFK